MIGGKRPLCVILMRSWERHAIGPFLDFVVYFSGKNNFFAPIPTLREEITDYLFSDALTRFPAIDIGDISEIDTNFESAVHNSERILRGSLSAKFLVPG
jgi:hypothetical protein